jgi:hypothetical protein
MRSLLLTLILILAIILQTTIIPDLALAFVFILATLKNFKDIWWVVILAAFFLEIFSGLTFGLISLSLLGAVCLINLLKRNFSAGGFWIKAIFAGLGISAFNLLVFLLNKLFHLDVFWNSKSLFAILGYDSLLIIILLSLNYGAKKIFHQRQG